MRAPRREDLEEIRRTGERVLRQHARLRRHGEARRLRADDARRRQRRDRHRADGGAAHLRVALDDRIRDDANHRDDEDDDGDRAAAHLLGIVALTSLLASAFGPRAHIAPLIARIALGLVFLAAGALKIGHASDLAATITAFGFGLPPVLVAVGAIALPPLEILLGVYLV